MGSDKLMRQWRRTCTVVTALLLAVGITVSAQCAQFDWELGAHAGDAAATAYVVSNSWDVGGNPREGMTYYDTTENIKKEWNGAAWETKAKSLGTRISVAPTDADYSTIAGALAVASAGDVITVAPGTYIETCPLAIPAGAILEGSEFATTILNLNGAVNVFEPGVAAVVRGFIAAYAAPAAAGSSGVYFGAGVSGGFARGIACLNCDYAVQDVSGGNNGVQDIFVLSDASVGISVSNGGTLSVSNTIITNATVTTYIESFGSGSRASITSIGVANATITNGLYAHTGGRIDSSAVIITGATNAVRIGAGGGTIFGYASTFDSTTYDVLVEDADGNLYLGGVTLRRDKLSIHPDAQRQGFALNDFGGDEGTYSIGELAVGLHTAGRESVFGEGDSHVNGMWVFRNTNLEAGVWSDVTTQARSHTGSTFDVFPGVAANNCIYVGSDSGTFPGVEVDVTTAIVIGGGSIDQAYWDGGSWANFSFMSSQADPPYAQYGEVALTRVQAEQVRFDDTPGWALKTLDGQSAYWARLCINSPITSVPQMQQIKLHTNRHEINADGFSEDFGNAIVERSIPLPEHRALTGGGAPGNLAISVSANIAYTGSRNGYSTGDGVAYIVPVPVGVDTSKPCTFSTLWKPSSTNTGDVNFLLYVVEANEGDVVAGTLAEVSISTIQAASGVADALEPITEHEFYIDDLVPGDVMFIGHTRNAASDTFTGTAEIMRRSLRCHFWQ